MAKRKSVSYVVDRMKMEIANEMGIELGAETPSRLNGAVGGEVVKRLIAFAEANMLDEVRELS